MLYLCSLGKKLRAGSGGVLGVGRLLVAGDKAGRWKVWYDEAIPLAEHRYEIYVKERQADEEGER